MRTPTGAGQLRNVHRRRFFSDPTGATAGPIFGSATPSRNFHGLLIGQNLVDVLGSRGRPPGTWTSRESTARNVIRQAQIRYTWQVRTNLSVAAALENARGFADRRPGRQPGPRSRRPHGLGLPRDRTPSSPRLVLRQIRGEPDLPATGVRSSFCVGSELERRGFRSHHFKLNDRFIFQLNLGEGKRSLQSTT